MHLRMEFNSGVGPTCLMCFCVHNVYGMFDVFFNVFEINVEVVWRTVFEVA